MDNQAIYGTYFLNRLIQRLVPEPKFFLDKFFSGPSVTSDREEVYFDDVPGKKVGIAPFVHPLNEAPMIRGQGYRTKSFRPGYIKEKTDLTPDRGFNRMPGEAFGGELTPMQRMERLLIRDVKRLQDRWSNRLEMMAAEVVKTGKLTIKGGGLDALLDFERDKSLGITLKGGDTWANPDFDMRSFFERRQANMARLNLRQRRPKTVLMHQSAYDLFIKNNGIQKILPDFMRGAELTLKLTPGIQSFDSLVFKGDYGEIRIFVYDAIAEDGKPFIDVNQILLFCDDIDGIKFFGAIHDLKAGLIAQDIFMKSWEIEDPSQRLVMLQSAPLLATFDPNTAELITVAS
jgi:hypothetical protein